MADQIGRKTPIVLGLITEFTGYALLFLPELSSEFPLVFLSILIAGIGRGIYYPIPSSIISDLVSPEKRGKILGIYRFILDFGYVIGSALLVIVIEPSLTQNRNPIAIYESSMLLVMMLMIIQTLLVSLLLKDPRPNFRQLKLVGDHIDRVKEAIHKLSLAIFEYSTANTCEAQRMIDQAKSLEREADIILETLIEHTYSGAVEAVDAIEILNFSQKMDKALGHNLRSLRKLLMIKDQISHQVIHQLCKFAVILDILVQEAVETISLVPIRISLASQQSYRVDRAEIVLDQIHQSLFQDVMDYDQGEDTASTVLLIQTIESLEKTANTVEDAVQLIRLIAIKHNA